MLRFRTALLLVCALLAVGALPARAQGLHVELTSSSDLVAPDRYFLYALDASNTGATDVTDVVVTLRLPDDIEGFYVSRAMVGESLDCGSAYCYPDRAVTWNVGTVAPGEHRTLLFHTRPNNATDGELEMRVTVSATGRSDDDFTHTVSVHDDATFELGLDPDHSPVMAGEPVAYTIHYGNAGTQSTTETTLHFEAPAGTSIVSASDGGVVEAGVARWDVGTLGVGAGGAVRVVVRPDAARGAGTLLHAAATIETPRSGVPSTTATSMAAVAGATPLKVAVYPGQSSVEPGGQASYTLVASNDGVTDATDVTVDFRMPFHSEGFYLARSAVGAGLDCGSSFCYGGRTAAWNVGTLAPGESRTLAFATPIGTGAPQGRVLHLPIVATSSSTGPVATAQSILVDPSPLFRVGLAADRHPARAGAPLTYTVAYGNIGTRSPTEAELRLDLPSAVEVTDISGGGTLEDGVVRWALGTVGVGTSGQVQVTAVPDASLGDGRLLDARAHVASGLPNEGTAHAALVTPIGGSSPLRFALDVSEGAVAPRGLLHATLTAANAGEADVTDVTVDFRMPFHSEGFYLARSAVGAGLDCGSSFCYGGRTAAWNVGTLAPGESRTLAFAMPIGTGAPQGDVLRVPVRVHSTSTAEAAYLVHATVDPSPVLEVDLAPATTPVEAGDTLGYVLSFGNVSERSTASVMLHVDLPEGADFVSATGGGQYVDGGVRWDVGTVAAGEVGQALVRMAVPATTAAGTLLTAYVVADPGTRGEVMARASATVSVGDAPPLDVRYAVDPLIVEPGGTVEVILSAVNRSASDLTDAVVDVLMPGHVTGFYASEAVGEGLDCGGSFCYGGRTYAWNLGTLGSGETRTLRFDLDVGDRAPRGTVLQSPLRASSTGSASLAMRRHVLIGSAFDFPTGVAIEDAPVPGAFALHAAYPNPFNPSTTLAFDLPAAAEVRLTVHDLLGRTVDEVVTARLAPGRHAYRWEAGPLPSGVYLVRLQADAFHATRTLTLLR